MLPWAIWSFFVRGILFGQTNFLNIKNLLWHMDSGYWFLATIWTISMIFGIASFVSEYIEKEKFIKKQIILLIVYLVGIVLLAGISMIMGLSFFAIKLTLYYMPFYYAGYLYGQISDKILESEKGKKIVDYVIAICFVSWLFVILRYSLFEMSDSGMVIILRAIASLTGCIAVCGLCKGIFSEKIGGLAWIGKNSLEIYLIHYLVLGLIKLDIVPVFGSVMGLGIVLVNYMITVLLAVMIIIVLNQNKVLSFIFRGKKR